MAAAKDSDPKTVMGAVNLLYETLEPFNADQRSQVMRAVALLLGVKTPAGGGGSAPRTNTTAPPQGGPRRG
jgi:hypothetical protein